MPVEVEVVSRCQNLWLAYANDFVRSSVFLSEESSLKYFKDHIHYFLYISFSCELFIFRVSGGNFSENDSTESVSCFIFHELSQHILSRKYQFTSKFSTNFTVIFLYYYIMHSILYVTEVVITKYDNVCKGAHPLVR